MGEDDEPRPIGCRLAGEIGGGLVVEMAVPAQDALLDRLGVGTGAQHLHVVVRLEDQEIAVAKSRAHRFGGMPEVGRVADSPPLAFDHIADRLDGVVRHGEWHEAHAQDREGRSGLDLLHHHALSIDPGRAAGAARAIDRHIVGAREEGGAPHMIGVIVGDDQGVEAVGLDADRPQPPGGLAA